MLLPEGVVIDGRTGAVTPSTDRYEKRLSDLRGFFQDDAALDRTIAEEGDRIAYEVLDYRHQDSDLAFGTTIMMPGKVGDRVHCRDLLGPLAVQLRHALVEIDGIRGST